MKQFLWDKLVTLYFEEFMFLAVNILFSTWDKAICNAYTLHFSFNLWMVQWRKNTEGLQSNLINSKRKSFWNKIKYSTVNKCLYLSSESNILIIMNNNMANVSTEQNNTME